MNDRNRSLLTQVNAQHYSRASEFRDKSLGALTRSKEREAISQSPTSMAPQQPSGMRNKSSSPISSQHHRDQYTV